MDAVKYFKLKARMTNADECGECQSSCNDCKLSARNNGKDLYCTGLEFKHPEKAVEIVEKWAAEHPVKTRQSEFLKIFPNAKLNEDGELLILPCHIYFRYTPEEGCDGTGCTKCKKEYWLEEVE